MTDARDPIVDAEPASVKSARTIEQIAADKDRVWQSSKSVAENVKSGAVRKQRSAEMRTVLAEAGEHYRQQFVGTQAQVLWESTDSFGPSGWRLNGGWNCTTWLAIRVNNTMWRRRIPG